jgi:hypothetical protein
MTLRSPRRSRRQDPVQGPLRQLHRRQVRGHRSRASTFDVITPVTGKVYTQAARSDAEDIELALDAAHAAADAWGKHRCRRPQQHPAQDRRPHRAEPGTAGLCRNRGQRQGDPRDAERRHPADGGPLPLLRRCAARAGRRHQRDRREHRGLPHPRAAGRGRPDHSLELPDPDGRLEAGAGPGCRQLRRAQAGRVHADLDPDPGRADRRPAAARRAQHRQRLSAARPACRWPPASASPRSPSPAPPPPAA